MKYLLNIATFILITSIVTLPCYAETNVQNLLSDGRKAIENGQYQKAVNNLGEILTASGNKSNDPKIMAFGATVQAYGLLNSNNPNMRPMAKQYLETAISNDPEWAYPKKLLKSIE